MRVDGPRVSVDKSNEQNIQALNSFCGEAADTINYLITLINNLTERLNALEKGDE